MLVLDEVIGNNIRYSIEAYLHRLKRLYASKTIIYYNNYTIVILWF